MTGHRGKTHRINMHGESPISSFKFKPSSQGGGAGGGGGGGGGGEEKGGGARQGGARYAGRARQAGLGGRVRKRSGGKRSWKICLLSIQL